MGIVSWIASWVRLMWRSVAKLTLYIIILTLPVTTLPVLNGLFIGWKFGSFLLDNGIKATKAFDSEAISAMGRDLSINLHQDNLPPLPYYVPQLRDPRAWWRTLGLTRLNDDGRPHYMVDSSNIPAIGSLEGLYRKLGKSEPREPWHHWIYASKNLPQPEGQFLDGWDESFYGLIQYHNANPSVGSASFHWVSCHNSFFCRMWLIDGPALIHFTTEYTEDIEQIKMFELGPQGPVPYGYERVYVRIMELPVTRMTELAVPPGTFPSYFTQLQGITGNTSIWQEHQLHFDLLQLVRYLYTLEIKWHHEFPNTLGLLFRLDNAWAVKLGFLDSSWYKVTRFIALMTTAFLRMGVSKLHRLLDQFLGKDVTLP